MSKIVSGSPFGAVAAESKGAQANWVILDKQLKHEKKKRMEELQCSIVVVKHSQAKVLRLNLVGSPDAEPHMPNHLIRKMNYTKKSQSKPGFLLNPFEGQL